jgi:hypothetical protein
MGSIERGVAWFWNRVGASTAPVADGLPVLRVIAGVFLLCFSAPYLSWLKNVPAAYYYPPLFSPGRLLPSFPPVWLCWALDVLLLSLCALVALGVRARLSTLLLCGFGLLRSNIAYSFGKIDHDIMVYVFLGCLAFSGWGRSLALVPDKPSKLDKPQHALALLGACLAYAMSSVGLQKAFNWLDFNTQTSGFLNWFLQGYFEYNRTALLASYVLDVPRWALELVDYSGVVFELGCLFTLLHSRFAFRVWLCCACAFHLINTLTLNIPFFEHMLVYFAFVDFSGVAVWLERAFSRSAGKGALTLLLAAMLVAHLWLRAVGHGSNFLFCVDKRQDQLLVLYVSAVCWALALLLMLVEAARLWQRSAAARSRSDAAET